RRTGTRVPPCGIRSPRPLVLSREGTGARGARGRARAPDGDPGARPRRRGGDRPGRGGSARHARCRARRPARSAWIALIRQLLAFRETIMAETDTQRALVDETANGDGPRDHPSPASPPQDPQWEQEAKPNLSKEERTMGLSHDDLRRMMRDMLLGRRFEEKAAEAYALGKIGGFCHLYIGQEAVAIG